jgi:hypothetical protein
LILAGNSIAHAEFLPENLLWMEDSFTASNVDEATFNQIIETGKTLYQREATNNHETLTIASRWDNSTVNAYMSRNNGQVVVTMFGGLARRPEITPEGFALVLCHELSHAYGGTPYIDVTNKVAAEGQADYMGAKVCMRRVIAALEFTYTPTPFIQKSCVGDAICEVSLGAGESTSNLLARLNGVPKPNYETPDRRVVSKTQLSYPATTQCRLDSYFNGTLNLARPKCWYYK